MLNANCVIILKSLRRASSWYDKAKKQTYILLVSDFDFNAEIWPAAEYC